MKKLLLILLALHCAAATVYVTKDGNDTTGDGSVSTPYLTIQKGLNMAAVGDTVLVGDGYYAEGYLQTVRSNVTLQSLNLWGAHTDALRIKQPMTTLRGMAFTNLVGVNEGTLVEVYKDLFNITIQSNHFRSRYQVNPYIRLFAIKCPSPGGGRTCETQGTNLTILNNVFEDNANITCYLQGNGITVASNRWGYNHGGDAIYLFGVNAYIHHNWFENLDSASDHGETNGLHCDVLQTFGTVTGVAPNCVPDNVNYMNHVYFYQNVVTNCSAQVFTFQAEGTTNFGDIFIFNNVFYNVGSVVGNFSVQGVSFINNTLVRCTRNTSHPFSFSASPTGGGYGTNCARVGSNGVVFNNIIVGCGMYEQAENRRGAFSYVTNAVPTYGYNYIAGDSTNGFTAKESTDTTDWSMPLGNNTINGGNPGMTDYANQIFTLLSNSSLRDTGTNLSSLFTTDMAGTTRGAAWDIGAYEYVGATNATPYTRMLQNLRRLRRLSE